MTPCAIFRIVVANEAQLAILVLIVCFGLELVARRGVDGIALTFTTAASRAGKNDSRLLVTIWVSHLLAILVFIRIFAIARIRVIGLPFRTTTRTTDTRRAICDERWCTG